MPSGDNKKFWRQTNMLAVIEEEILYVAMTITI